jgi:hypothetical protein
MNKIKFCEELISCADRFFVRLEEHPDEADKTAYLIGNLIAIVYRDRYNIDLDLLHAGVDFIATYIDLFNHVLMSERISGWRKTNGSVLDTINCIQDLKEFCYQEQLKYQEEYLDK